MNIKQLYTNYLNDKDFRAKVQAKPKTFESKIDTQSNATVKIVFDKSDTVNVVMPNVASTLSDSELYNITGGVGQGLVGFAVIGNSGAIPFTPVTGPLIAPEGDPLPSYNDTASALDPYPA